MHEATPASQLAFEDADVPSGIDMRPVDPALIPTVAYTSPEYAARENDLLWCKVWQQACREEEIPDVGDYVTYDIVDESIIVVRTAPDKVQAFYNVCQHRGRQITEGCGNAKQFICKFHGWRWKISGETAFINDRKGYDGCLTNENTRLEPVKVDSWGGWLWVNMDPDSEPLRDYLEPIATLLDPYQLEKMRYRWRQWLVFPCNWKTALEAFNESHHAAISHPQLCEWGTTPFYWCRTAGKHAWHGPAISNGPGKPGAQTPDTPIEQPDVRDPRVTLSESLNAIMEGVNSCTTDTMLAAAARLLKELPPGTSAQVVAERFNQVAQAIDAERGHFLARAQSLSATRNRS